MELLKNNNRILWLDALKGIGILFVVAGHIFDSRFFYVFHMPLFFFIAGMTLRPHASLTRYIRKKALRLLTPYISFMLIIATVALCISGSYGEGYKTLLLGGHYAQGIYGVFWFITVLLGALVLSQFIIARKLNIWAAIISFLLLSIPI